MRVSRALCLTVTIVFFLCHATAVAAPVSQGSKEYYGGLSFATTSYSHKDYDDTMSLTELIVSPGFGYFVTDNLEFRTDLVLAFDKIGNGGSYSQNTIGADVLALWHFPSESNVVPFIGAGAGFSIRSDSEDGDYEPQFLLPAVSGGMKVFLTETACLTVEAVYSREVNGLYAEDVSGNTVGLVVGFSLIR